MYLLEMSQLSSYIWQNPTYLESTLEKKTKKKQNKQKKSYNIASLACA